MIRRRSEESEKGSEVRKHETRDIAHKQQQKRVKSNGDEKNTELTTVGAAEAASVLLLPVGGGHKVVKEEEEEEEAARPKSRKELRAEKKKALRAVAARKSDEAATADDDKNIQRQQEKKERQQAAERASRKERQQAAKLRKRKRANRLLNAPKRAVRDHGTARDGREQAARPRKTIKQHKDQQNDDDDNRDSDVLRRLYEGTTDGTTTTLRLGVQIVDVVPGAGPGTVRDGSAVTVRYRLTGGRFGAVLDSSDRFSFRVGQGEVIQGWDIGLVGMRVGGKRRVTVPPKAGYGSRDIGAGPGATLSFDIALLSCDA